MLPNIITLTAKLVTPSADEETLLEQLCSAQVALLTARLRHGLVPADCGDAFPLAAAMLSAAALLSLRQAEGVTHFTAGELSLRFSPSDSVDALRKNADCLMAPFVADPTFAFRGVDG